jgi:endonuclease/exonuclease/phosphatase family metal-dependent hydrolase
MPFYNRLRLREGDSSGRKAEKVRIATRLIALRAALHDHLYGDGGPAAQTPVEDVSRYLRLATWNIREFGSGAKFGPRSRESLYYIAEILSHFDLIAVQEVHRDREALDHVLNLLGPGWTYIATDVAAGSSGNSERMAMVYNTHKAWFRQIAGEVVLSKASEIEYPHEERLRFGAGLSLELPEGARLASPPDVAIYRRAGKERLKAEVPIDLPEGTWLQLPQGTQLVLPHRHVVTRTEDGRVVLPEGTRVALPQQAMLKLPGQSIVGDTLQFARTPFLVAFQAGWLKLNLCTVHITYGKGDAGMRRRNQEIRKLTEFLAQRAQSERDTDADSFFVLLGDFNIVGRDHATMRSLLTNGFAVPDKLQALPGTNVDKTKYYDQIAYWAGRSEDDIPDGTVTRVEVARAGVFDFFETVYRAGASDPEGTDEAFYRSRARLAPDCDYAEWRTYQMSDHLPMWVEMRIDFGEEYLRQIAGGA